MRRGAHGEKGSFAKKKGMTKRKKRRRVGGLRGPGETPFAAKGGGGGRGKGRASPEARSNSGGGGR